MIREFTENDWSLFAGAEPFTDGKEPLIDDSQDDLVFVASRNGFEVISSDAEQAYLLDVQFPNQMIARTLLAALPGTIEELVDLGFERIV